MEKPEHVAFQVLSRDQNSPKDIRRSTLVTEIVRVSDIKNVRRFHLKAEDQAFFSMEFSAIYLDRGRGDDDPKVIVKGSVSEVCKKLGLDVPDA